MNSLLENYQAPKRGSPAEVRAWQRGFALACQSIQDNASLDIFDEAEAVVEQAKKESKQ